MADPETLAALKRAYADTILNTTKEAAARVIVSEKRARMFQQELVTVRDEAIHTLLRLKQMFDSKVKETEMISLRQQQKVEELEAQLGEAEDIVGELRMELRVLRDELKKVTNGQTHRKSEHEEDSCLKKSDAAVSEVSSSHERSGAVGSCIPAEQSGLLVPNGIKKTSLTCINSINRCSSKDNKDRCHHTLPSILTKRREAEGCIRMIHAVDRSVASGDLSSSVEVGDVLDGVCLPKVSSCKSVETLEMSGCADASDSISSVRDKEDPMVSRNSSQKDIETLIPLKTSVLKKRREAEGCTTRMIHAVDRSVASGVLSSSVEVGDMNDDGVCLHKSLETLEMSGCADASDTISSVRDKEDPMVSRNSSQQDVGTPIPLKTSILTKRREAEGCTTQVIDAVDRSVPSGDLSSSVEIGDVNDGVCLHKSVETLEMSGCADASDSISSVRDEKDPMVSRNSSQKDIETPIPLKTSLREDENDRKLAIVETEATKEEKENCKNVEVSASSLCEETPVLAVNKNRCIKYTFQRKRKKEVLSNAEGDSSVEESGNKKQKTGEKDDGYLDSLKPRLTNESSRDSLRVAQVARQLVPFSEKKGFAAEVVNK